MTCFSEGRFNVQFFLYSFNKIYPREVAQEDTRSQKHASQKYIDSLGQSKTGDRFIIESYFNSLIKIENHAIGFVISEMIVANLFCRWDLIELHGKDINPIKSSFLTFD